jgi:hypothetical protein
MRRLCHLAEDAFGEFKIEELLEPSGTFLEGVLNRD